MAAHGNHHLGLRSAGDRLGGQCRGRVRCHFQTSGAATRSYASLSSARLPCPRQCRNRCTSTLRGKDQALLYRGLSSQHLIDIVSPAWPRSFHRVAVSVNGLRCCLRCLTPWERRHQRPTVSTLCRWCSDRLTATRAITRRRDAARRPASCPLAAAWRARTPGPSCHVVPAPAVSASARAP
jgi:hypothetical protein